MGLPGHPVSALVIFDLFAAPLLRVVGGEDPAGVFAPRATVRARLGQNVASQAGREDYVRVRLAQVNQLVAHPLAGKWERLNLVSADAWCHSCQRRGAGRRGGSGWIRFRV